MAKTKKKGKKYGRIIAVMVAMVLILGLAGFAAAEFVYFSGTRDKQDYSFGKEGRSARQGWINTLVGEGATTNTSQTFIYFADPSGDNAIVIPDSSGTIALTGDIASTITLADTQLIVGQSTGLGAAKTMTGDVTITNALVATIGANAITSAKILDNSVSSADILNGTIAATDIGANAVGSSELNVSTVEVFVAVGAASGTATVTSGATILGFYPFANINDEVANIVGISSTTLTLTIDANATEVVPVWKVVILEP